jgi:hypothetical protein
MRNGLGRWLTSLLVLGALAWAEIAVGSTFYRPLTYDACRDLRLTIYYCLEMQRIAALYTTATRAALVILASLVLLLLNEQGRGKPTARTSRQ